MDDPLLQVGLVKKGAVKEGANLGKVKIIRRSPPLSQDALCSVAQIKRNIIPSNSGAVGSECWETVFKRGFQAALK